MVENNSRFFEFTDELLATASLDAVVELTLRYVGALDQNVSSAFFKYFPNRRSLVLTASQGFKNHKFDSVNVNLNELENDSKIQDLQAPEVLAAIAEKTQFVFARSEFHAHVLKTNGHSVGLFLFFEKNQKLQETADFVIMMKQIEHHLKLLDIERRLHVVSSRDDVTDVLHRQNFLENINLEISRARRTQLPVSLILLKADQMPAIVNHFGQDEADLLLKMLAKIFRKHSRLTDIVGRTGSDEFGILLPHTPYQGAAIKAERIRRTIESADFSKLVRKVTQLTVSCGVSEYPRLCRDADELFTSTDSALFEVVKNTSNRVCMATISSGFVADFIVSEPPWLKGGGFEN